MRLLNYLRLLVVAMTLYFPLEAKAASELNLSFEGVVSRNMVGSVLAYAGGSPPDTAFVDLPFTANLSIHEDGGVAYVDYFNITWSNQNYETPVITGWVASGSAPGSDEAAITFFSTVSLTNAGGQISIAPSEGYIGYTDGFFDFDLNYALSTPQSQDGPFSDVVTGGGTVNAFVNDGFDPVLGPYDASTYGDFTLSSVTATVSLVPEPAAWSIMLVGLAALGAALRVRRASDARQAARIA